ncbi:Ig-like domain-containing protein [Demequina litorisediminis]|uniref:Bacterial Ig-like domain-containing protein n=1 Tax=Demequina litorisediminis TaxID=1849022 RepID=A0ABQ6IFD9_9MICO|nr:Ig-like domain-containing protein [Demequina litorisediminis]GMA36431.1 hypothetical protein GCM10025876_26350 [Demequina litorisediminis]
MGIQYSEDGTYPYLFADGSADAPVRGVDFQIVKECGHLEAPALFTEGGKYYVIASGATGWAPNPQTYHSADEILGTWIRGVEADDAYENVSYNSIPEGGDGLLSVGDTRRTTFGSQSTNVVTLAPGKHVYMGDRWNAGASDSTYVWLPITIGEGGRLEMRNPAVEDPERWGDGWDESYWDDKGAGEGVWTVADDSLPETVRRGADPAEVLPDAVEVTTDGVASTVGVTWEDADLSRLGVVTLTGTLDADGSFGAGRAFTREVRVWDYGMVNLAGASTVTVSSRTSLAATLTDGDTAAKGWDDWTGSGYPLASTLAFAWASPQRADEVVVHTYADGGATWPSRIAVEYRDAAGAWAASDVAVDVSQEPGRRCTGGDARHLRSAHDERPAPETHHRDEHLAVDRRGADLGHAGCDRSVPCERRDRDRLVPPDGVRDATCRKRLRRLDFDGVVHVDLGDQARHRGPDGDNAAHLRRRRRHLYQRGGRHPVCRRRVPHPGGGVGAREQPGCGAGR